MERGKDGNTRKREEMDVEKLLTAIAILHRASVFRGCEDMEGLVRVR